MRMQMNFQKIYLYATVAGLLLSGILWLAGLLSGSETLLNLVKFVFVFFLLIVVLIPVLAILTVYFIDARETLRRKK